MKPEHLIWCGACKHFSLIYAYPSEVCGQDCGGCEKGLHCVSCSRRGIKQYQNGYVTKTWIGGVTTKQYGRADEKPRWFRDSSDIKKRLKEFSSEETERRQYDVKYSTEWGDGE
jgi:hypothetical protein